MCIHGKEVARKLVWPSSSWHYKQVIGIAKNIPTNSISRWECKRGIREQDLSTLSKVIIGLTYTTLIEDTSCREIAKRSTTLMQYIYPHSLITQKTLHPFSKTPLFFFSFQFLSASRVNLKESWRSEEIVEAKGQRREHC